MNRQLFISRRPAHRALARSFASIFLATLAALEAQPLPSIGLSAAFAQLHQEAGSYPHSPGAADYFGHAIAVGDFNRDGYDDLATGIPGNDCDFQVWDCGAVQVRFGFSVGALGGFVTLDPNGVGPSGELPPEPAHAHDRYGEALAVGDFNADGHDDLAVGIPANRINPEYSGGGAVQIHYGLPGAAGSIQWVAEHFLDQNSNGVPSPAWVLEEFGAELVAGDFNGDGHSDLAISAPFDLFGSPPYQAGNVIVAHGHIGGLVPFGGFEMRLGLQGLPDQAEPGEEFGRALAAADFNGDGFDDLAIGVPREDDVGAVLVVYGSASSLVFSNHWYFGEFDLNGNTQPGSRFGEVLAAGDFDDDGFADLVVGVPKYDGGGGLSDLGVLAVLYGGAAGLGTARVEWLWEDLLFGAQTGASFDNFGSALVAGDFNADGTDDLAIGILGENGPSPNNGAVAVLLGRRQQTLLGGTVRKLFPRGVAGTAGYDPAGMIPDHQSGEPFWGFSLATGDFDGNGFADLALGSPGRDGASGNGPLTDSGAVAVLYGQLFADGFEGGNGREWSALVP